MSALRRSLLGGAVGGFALAMALEPYLPKFWSSAPQAQTSLDVKEKKIDGRPYFVANTYISECDEQKKTQLLAPVEIIIPHDQLKNKTPEERAFAMSAAFTLASSQIMASGRTMKIYTDVPIGLHVSTDVQVDLLSGQMKFDAKAYTQQPLIKVEGCVSEQQKPDQFKRLYESITSGTARSASARRFVVA